MVNECIKCGSVKIIPEVKTLDRAEDGLEKELKIGIDEKPGAYIFKERFRTGIKAKVCGHCGFIEFYANDPEELYQAYLKQLANDKNNR